MYYHYGCFHTVIRLSSCDAGQMAFKAENIYFSGLFFFLQRKFANPYSRVWNLGHGNEWTNSIREKKNQGVIFKRVNNEIIMAQSII